MKKGKKNNILKQELNITVVYILIFIVGIAIVLFMTNYLNKQVKSIEGPAIVTSE